MARAASVTEFTPLCAAMKSAQSCDLGEEAFVRDRLLPVQILTVRHIEIAVQKRSFWPPSASLLLSLEASVNMS
jgi:hypothetical protein